LENFVQLFLLLSLLCSAARSAPVAASGKVVVAVLEKEETQLGPELNHGLGSLVNSLLASLLRQTLYNRMENLLLDDGGDDGAMGGGRHKPVNDERKRIVDSAVRNYQNQDMRHGGAEDAQSRDFTKLAGEFFISRLDIDFTEMCYFLSPYKNLPFLQFYMASLSLRACTSYCKGFRKFQACIQPHWPPPTGSAAH
jgi:hypothetical protein